jgi:hypothetical protein
MSRIHLIPHVTTYVVSVSVFSRKRSHLEVFSLVLFTTNHMTCVSARAAHGTITLVMWFVNLQWSFVLGTEEKYAMNTAVEEKEFHTNCTRTPPRSLGSGQNSLTQKILQCISIHCHTCLVGSRSSLRTSKKVYTIPIFSDECAIYWVVRKLYIPICATVVFSLFFVFFVRRGGDKKTPSLSRWARKP